MPDPRIDALRARCTRSLSHHGRDHESPARTLRALAAACGEDVLRDAYGEGELIEGLERDVARLLGHEAAVFLPSGTMAQQIALRIWADRKGPRNVAFHPLSHLEIHEHLAYRHLHGLHGVVVGSRWGLVTLDDLKKVVEPLSAVLLELPQREIGGRLPSWEELSAISAWAREKGIALHLDGARLWECGPFYGKEYAEIAGLFDSVYVSFYKGLGGIAGCVLSGPASLAAEARVWQRRHGGNLVQLYPYVLSARAALAERLPRMPEYVARARSIAARLSGLAGIEVVPDPPHTNMMHLHLPGAKERLEAAALALAEETSVWLFGKLQPGPTPSRAILEVTVGDAAKALSDDEIAGLFEALIERARRPPAPAPAA